MLNFRRYFILLEGGNIFKGVTRRIKRQEVPPTVEYLESITGLNIKDNLLGSTGKTETSGDIDVCVDESLMSKDTLISMLLDRGAKLKEDIVKSGISVSYKTPIYSSNTTSTGDFVQTDFMFTSSCDYLKWFYSSEEKLPYKGRDKNILLSSIASSKGYTLSMKGLSNKQTKELVSLNPKEIIKLVLGKDATTQDGKSIASIIMYLKKSLPEEEIKRMIEPAEKTTGFSFL
jgi:DNA polymerase/3'-5' exonuclease PolX